MRWRFIWTGMLVAALCSGVAVTCTWPIFCSEEYRMTGVSFRMTEVASVDESSFGEGHKVWMYRFGNDAAKRIQEQGDRIQEFPLWYSLGFDSYRQVKWTPVAEAFEGSELGQLLAYILREPSAPIDVDDVSDVEDAYAFARHLADQKGTLVAAQYYIIGNKPLEDRPPSDWFVYIMNTEKGILVKLTLLT